MTVSEGVGGSIAPLRQDASHRPWTWVAYGVGVYRRHLRLASAYGFLFVLFGHAIAWVLRNAGMAAAMPVAIGAFVLAGPLMAAGLYALARADEAGETVSIRDIFLPHTAAPLQMAYLAVVMLIAVLFWLVVATGLFVIFLGGAGYGWDEFTRLALSTVRGIAMLGLGTVLGGVIAAMIFAATAFSVPMLMEQKVDFATAIGRSVRGVVSHPRDMVLWAWIILAMVTLGVLTGFIGFVALFPILGFATWRSYRSEFPPAS